MIDWTLEVKEYEKQYDDEDGIHEYIDSLLPVYYGDIYQTYHDVIGTPLSIEIEPEHVGMAFWKILNYNIAVEYFNSFWKAWNEAEEEE